MEKIIYRESKTKTKPHKQNLINQPDPLCSESSYNILSKMDLTVLSF